MKRFLSIICTAAIFVTMVLICPVVFAMNQRGDVNGDSTIDMKDVLLLRKAIADLAQEYDAVAADCNGDSAMDMKDVLLLRKYIADMDVELAPIEETSEVITTTTVEPTQAPTTTTKATRDFVYDTIPDQITLSYYDEACTQMGVSWHTTKKANNPVVQYVKVTADVGPDFSAADASYATMKSYKTKAAPYDKDSNMFFLDTTVGYSVIDDYSYHAVMTGLEFGTTYAYRIGDQTDGVWSEVAIFKTRDANVSEFSFLYTSDTQGTGNTNNFLYQNMEKVFSGAAITNPDFKFIINGGDVTQNPKYLHEWQNILNGNKNILKSYPFMLVSGNHEASISNYSDTDETYRHTTVQLPQPNSNINRGIFYSFSYGNAHFIVLNSDSYDKTNGCIDEEQLEWFKSDMENNAKKWNIVLIHRPLIPLRDTTTASLEQLAPLFAQYKIDLVFQAHEHIYMRSYPIASDGSAIKDINTKTVNGVECIEKPEGFVCITSATGGDQAKKSSGLGAGEGKYIAYSDAMKNSWTDVTVSDDAIILKSYAANGDSPKAYPNSVWGITK